MLGKHFTSIEDETLINKLNSGYSYNQIGKLLNRTRYSIASHIKILKKNNVIPKPNEGLPKTHRKGGARRTVSSTEMKKIMEMYHKGYELREMEKETGRSYTCIWYIIDKIKNGRITTESIKQLENREVAREKITKEIAIGKPKETRGNELASILQKLETSDLAEVIGISPRHKEMLIEILHKVIV